MELKDKTLEQHANAAAKAVGWNPEQNKEADPQPVLRAPPQEA